MMPALKIGAAIAAATAIALMSPAATAGARTKAASPRSGPPSFCVDRSGANGPGSSILDCRYDDYQSCVAAATVRGNCVRNIDAK